MSLTNFRTLGRSGLAVSHLALGTMTFGAARWGSADDVSFSDAVVAAATPGSPGIDGTMAATSMTAESTAWPLRLMLTEREAAPPSTVAVAAFSWSGVLGVGSSVMEGCPRKLRKPRRPAPRGANLLG